MSRQDGHALCCTCGRARTLKMTVGSTYKPPKYDYEAATGNLKCNTCGRITRHALVMSDEAYADWRRRVAGLRALYLKPDESAFGPSDPRQLGGGA